MRSLRCFHIVLVLGAGALMVPALQPWQPAPVDLRFERLDRNGDGFLSVPELDATESAAVSFQQADHDRDGLLSSPEFQAALDAPPRHR